MNQTKAFEETVIKNKINELTGQICFALEVLGISVNDGNVEFIKKLEKLQQWQTDLLQ